MKQHAGRCAGRYRTVPNRGVHSPSHPVTQCPTIESHGDDAPILLIPLEALN